MIKKSILVVDDDKIILDSLCEFLSLEGFEAVGMSSIKESLEALHNNNYELVIADVNLPDGDGFELLEILQKNYPQTVPILITAYGTIDSAVKAIKHGCLRLFDQADRG